MSGNQYRNKATEAAKEATTQSLAKVVSVQQSVSSHSSADRLFYAGRDTEAYHRILEIDGILDALTREKQDLETCRKVYAFATQTFEGSNAS